MIVQACSEKLLSLKYGWMKFKNTKSAKFCPGFVHPPDEDGKSRAQTVGSSEYPSSEKFLFFEFNDNLPEQLKTSHGKFALKMLNAKFKFDLK